MKNQAPNVNATFLLIKLNGFIWLGFGLLILLGAHPSYENADVLRWAMSAISLLTAASLASLLFFLKRRNRIAYWLLVALLSAMIFATMFDQFGWADLIFVFISALPLALLIKERRWYLGSHPVPELMN